MPFKQYSLILFLLLIISGCNDNSELTFENYRLTDQSCAECSGVQINIPYAAGKSRLAESINSAVREEIFSLLVYDTAEDINTIDDAVASFHRGYEELTSEFPGGAAGWEARIEARISYENDKVISLQLETYSYTGGAHGYGSTRYLNFDKIKGEELEDWQLFQDTREFSEFAEHVFREQELIPAGDPINSTGFMFESGSFYLPENIGFTPLGITLHYNQYEVASYADGPIDLTIPYEEIRVYLNPRLRS